MLSIFYTWPHLTFPVSKKVRFSWCLRKLSLGNEVTCLRPQSEEWNPNCQTARSWSWPLGCAAFLHLEQVKGELLSGCSGRSEGLDIQYNLFSKKWISREDCFSDLWGFAGCLSGLASPIGQAGLPAWRTGKKVEPTPICMPACYVQQSVPGGEGKWRKQQLSISKIVKLQLAEEEEKKKNES